MPIVSSLDNSYIVFAVMFFSWNDVVKKVGERLVQRIYTVHAAFDAVRGQGIVNENKASK